MDPIKTARAILRAWERRKAERQLSAWAKRDDLTLSIEGDVYTLEGPERCVVGYLPPKG